jgi:type IV pilus assembly protein PilA
MLSPLKLQDEKREEGFTLIELLVVVIIIGILAAIAIPVFMNQRDKARDSAVQSTLRSAATYMEILYTESGDDTYPDDANLGAALGLLEEQGFRSGSQVTVTDYTLREATTTEPAAYCLVAVHGGTVDETTGAYTADSGGNAHVFQSQDGTPVESATESCTVTP